jgi:YD repeat-containing protein
MVIIGLVGYSSDPFYTEARQRIDGTRYFTIRKYYGGLGTLLETQVLGAELSTGSQDVVVSSWQGYALEGGQVRAVQAQSVPYAIPSGYGFRGWDYVINNSYAYSRTVLDELGRPLTVTAPDGAGSEYSYADGYSNNNLPFLQTTVTDAEGHATVTTTDIWGRSVMVDAPDGPSVSYTYDVADRLVGVTYGTATTMLQYDLAGRKTQMTDPDMGIWYYRYNALGELVRQTDARGQRICLYYDDLGRLTGKHYRTDNDCPSSPTLNVGYIYDQGTNGVGQRTRMDYGAGSYTTWSYDARGRLQYETQVIDGSGIFQTQYAYNSADLPVWMRYPANNTGEQGEIVNYTYNTQMLLDQVTGTDTYVDDTWYDAAGRVTLRELGSNYTLGQSYAYYPWTQQGGRLQSLQSGLPADPDSLQSLSYSYDSVGNVETISDFGATSNPSDPQLQTFGYDALDRLINAQATNGETNGRYPQQSYDYNDTTGNMATNAGMSYAYTYPNAPAGVAPAHGVRQVTGGPVFNGTVTIRARRGTGCTTLPEMKLYINGTLRQQWTVTNKSSYSNYSVATGVTADAQVDVVFSNATSGCTLQVDYVTIPTATGTRTVQAESGGTIFDRGTEAGAPGANAFDGVNLLNGAELMSETGSLRFVVGLNALAAGYDANGNMTLRLKDGARYFLAYDAESRMTSVSGTVSASFAYNGDGQRGAPASTPSSPRTLVAISSGRAG